MTEAEAVKKLAIAPRFTLTELDAIDRFRGEATKTEFVYDAVIQHLERLHKAELEAKKKSALRHDCGKKFDVLECKDGTVFLICKKCHISKKLSQDEFKLFLETASAQNAATIEVHILPDKDPSTNETKEATR